MYSADYSVSTLPFDCTSHSSKHCLLPVVPPSQTGQENPGGRGTWSPSGSGPRMVLLAHTYYKTPCQSYYDQTVVSFWRKNCMSHTKLQTLIQKYYKGV